MFLIISKNGRRDTEAFSETLHDILWKRGKVPFEVGSQSNNAYWCRESVPQEPWAVHFEGSKAFIIRPPHETFMPALKVEDSHSIGEETGCYLWVSFTIDCGVCAERAQPRPNVLRRSFM